jgi:hypothetical protein
MCAICPVHLITLLALIALIIFGAAYKL